MKYVLAGLLLLAGCAGVGDRDAAVISVTEYGVSGGILSRGEVGGCAVHQTESKPSAEGKSSQRIAMIYRGDKCEVQVQSK